MAVLNLFAFSPSNTIELIIGLEQEFGINLEYTDTTEMTSIPIIKSKILKLLNDK